MIDETLAPRGIVAVNLARRLIGDLAVSDVCGDIGPVAFLGVAESAAARRHQYHAIAFPEHGRELGWDQLLGAVRPVDAGARWRPRLTVPRARTALVVALAAVAERNFAARDLVFADAAQAAPADAPAHPNRRPARTA